MGVYMSYWQKWIKRCFVILILVAFCWLVNITWFKPFTIDSFFERYFIEHNLASPELMSRVHLFEKWTLKLFSGKWDDLSEENMRHHDAFITHHFDMLIGFKDKSLSAQELISAELLENQLEDYIIRREQFADFHYEINHINGAHVFLPDFLMHIHQIRTLKDAEKYIERLGGIATRIEQPIQKLFVKQEDGTLTVNPKVVLPPKFILNHVAAQVKRFLAFDSIQNNILYKDFLHKIEIRDNIKPEAKAELLYELKIILEDELVPVYQTYLEQVNLLNENTSDDAGLSQYETGDLYYAYLLRYHLTEDISPDTLYAMAEQEIEEIQSKMRNITDDLGYSHTLSLGKIMRTLAMDKRFMHSPNTRGEMQFFDSLRRDIDEFKTKSKKLFYRVPDVFVDVSRMNPLMEAYTPLIEYIPGSIDQERHAKMLFNLIDWPEIPKFRIRPLVARHIFPGHHLQSSFQIQAQHLPTFRRALEITAYSEGWNHYAQQLAQENQFFHDPYEKLSVLHDDLLLAAKILADIGMHRYDWSREKAIETIYIITEKPEREIIAEVDECVIFPGKAPAYLYGYKKIINLRNQWKEYKKDQFDIREFHQLILEDGQISLRKLEQKILQKIKL